MTLSVYQPYDEITVTSRVYRAIVKIRKTGATITSMSLPSRDGRCTILKDVVISGTGSDLLRATTNLDRLLNPHLYR